MKQANSTNLVHNNIESVALGLQKNHPFKKAFDRYGHTWINGCCTEDTWGNIRLTLTFKNHQILKKFIVTLILFNNYDIDSDILSDALNSNNNKFEITFRKEEVKQVFTIAKTGT